MASAVTEEQADVPDEQADPALPRNEDAGWAGQEPVDTTEQVSAREDRLVVLPVIEQAKGALMITYGLTADAAFAVLRWHSQNRNIKVRDIAAELVARALHHPLTATTAGAMNQLLNTVTSELSSTSNDVQPHGRATDPAAEQPPRPRP